MLFERKVIKANMKVLESINVFQSGDEVHVEIFDEYVKVTSKEHNMNLFFQHIVECNEIDNSLQIVYYNAKKERRELFLSASSSDVKKIQKGIKKKM